ncbi:GOLPH3/VPS74 family protein [Frankia sp. CiP1_Cm_nod1]|uniref:GOLPH3/VPS74 family protein n=1 Tax=Frankia sp. CiP1_Cm_nod1 TaxID=2897160 RepID=UPI0020244B95
MNLPESLPARLYLASYDIDRQRLTGRLYLGYLLRAAALTDLFLTGHLSDVKGRARVIPPSAATGRVRDVDPLLAGILKQITGSSRPRSWQYWIRREARPAVRAVRDQLETAGWIRVEPRRILHLFPADAITVRDPRVVRELHANAGRVVHDGVPPARVDPYDAAVVALAAAAQLRTVLTRAQQREHRARIAQLAEICGPPPIALRKVIVAAQA